MRPEIEKIIDEYFEDEDVVDEYLESFMCPSICVECGFVFEETEMDTFNELCPKCGKQTMTSMCALRGFI